MPMYNYVCECGHRVDGVLAWSVDPVPAKCTKCGKDMKREIGTTSPPVFKGKGFYETDYKTKGKE